MLVRVAVRRGGLLMVGGVALGVGLALFLPQFFAPPAVRIVHGVILGGGALVVAVSGARARERQPVS